MKLPHIHTVINIIFTMLIIVAFFSLQDKLNDVKDTEKQLGVAYNSAVEMKTIADSEFEKLDCIYRIAEKNNVPPEVILAVMKVESGFKTDVASNSSYGLMQVNECHLESYGLNSPDKLFDVETNVTIGTKILGSCIANSADMHEALGKYNRGINGYRQYVSRTGNTATEYSQKVINNM